MESVEVNCNTMNNPLLCLSPLRTCRRCKQDKPKCEFPKWRKNPDGSGLARLCFTCNREQNIKNYYKHQEEYKAKSKVRSLAYYYRKKAEAPPPPPKVIVPKPKPTKLKRPEGSIYKRCRTCRHPLYPMPSDTYIQCDKCDTEYKIVPALCVSRHNRGGIILQVIL
jgi:hypothetical protein